MPHSDDLYDLIQSLSPPEKRYFKLHAEKLGDGAYKMQYVKLFDALNNWPDEHYEEKEFRKKNRGKMFLKNLADDKLYLRELIMKVIRNYGAYSNPETELSEMLLNIKLLINKGLKSQVNKLIEKARRLAEEREQYNDLLVLNDLLLKFYRLNPGEAPYNVSQIEQMDKDAVDRLMLTRQALYLQNHMMEIQRGGQWKAREKEARQIMGAASALADNPNLPRKAEVYLLGVRQVYLVHFHRYQECLDITMQWLDKIEKAQSSFSYSPDQYKVLLSYYLHCAFKDGKFDLFPPAIEKLKSLKANTDKEAAEYFRTTAQYELTYLTNIREFSKADEMLRHVEDGLKKHKRFIDEHHMILYRFNIALLFFIRNKYEEALKHINTLYYLSGRDESYTYTNTLARIVEWMCQYSLGEYTILDASLRNFKRYLADRQMKNELFDGLTELFGTLLKEAGKRPESITTIKKRISESSAPKEWEQIKEMVSIWL